MAGAAARFLIAIAAGCACVILAICAVTGRWPSIVTVRNSIEDASCSLAFSDGWTWDVDLRNDQKKFWIFILGKPDSVKATCRTESRTIERSHAFCYGAFDYLFAITEDPHDNFCVAA